VRVPAPTLTRNPEPESMPIAPVSTVLPAPPIDTMPLAAKPPAQRAAVAVLLLMRTAQAATPRVIHSESNATKITIRMERDKRSVDCSAVALVNSRNPAGTFMHIEVFPDETAVAAAAARLIAAAAREAVATRGRFLMAVSGGKTPWAMLRDLASEDVPWSLFHVFQVDERLAADGDPDRNLTHLHASLLGNAPIPPENIHAMPVTAPEAAQGAIEYELILATRRCLILCTWASAPTVTRHHSSLAIPRSTVATATWR